MASAGDTVLNTDKPLQYQGRKTSRAKSEQRRRVILEAALRIVVNEGVRGIRHRAVAKEAGVPLAATTYYFKDIQELIVDAFTLYTEKALHTVEEFTRQFYQLMASMTGADIRSEEEQQALAEFMVEQLTVYLREQIVTEHDMLVAEQAFRYEAIVNERIRELAIMHRRVIFERALAFFRDVAGSAQPEADAEIVLGLLHSLEYRALLDPQNGDMASVKDVVRRYVGLLLPSLISGAG